MKITKIIMALLVLVLMTATVSAFEVYNGPPGVPYIVRGSVDWNNQYLAGVRIEVSNADTGFVTSVVTDSNGYWLQDSGNWLTSESARPPVMYGDVISVRAVDGCGTNDVCTKSFVAKSGDNINYAEVNLVLTGDSSCPTVICPGRSCSPCNCGSGGIVKVCTLDEAEKMVECPAQKTCPVPKVCADDLECELCGLDLICPDPIVCEDKECPESDSGIVSLLITFVVSLLGGLAVGRYVIPNK